MRAALAGRLAVCALVLVARASGAEPPPRTKSAAPAPQANAPLQGPAKDAYDSAKLLVQNRDFAGALAKFKQAYDLSAAPEMLYDMAICEKNLLHYARMQALLLRYQVEGERTLSPADRKAVEAALAAIKNLVAQLDVRVDVDGATVLIDGDAVGTSPLPRPVAVDLGERTVTVQKDDFVPVTRKVESSGGGTLAVTVSLVPIKHGGQLLVTSDADATVSVDGQVVGRGRFEAPLAVGAHDVRVTEPGKVPYESQVDVRDGERRTVDVTLQNQPHAAVWPWIVGGAVIAAAGATVGGYFLFKSGTQASAPATGSLSTVQLSGWGRP